MFVMRRSAMLTQSQICIELKMLALDQPSELPRMTKRKRQGFEIQTTFSFDESSYTAKLDVEDDLGDILSVDYAQAAYISRINKGLRRRKDQAQVGFHINPKTGVWLGQPNENEAQNNPERIVQLIVPLVEDRKNALLIRSNERWVADLGEDEEKTLTTVQHALARGIEAVFQLEEGEILLNQRRLVKIERHFYFTRLLRAALVHSVS